MIKNLLFVGIGGGAGSIARYLISLLTHKYYQNTFPLATFIVNIIGCLLIGFLLGVFSKNFPGSPELKLLLISGFCGGLTTFSAFSSENMVLLQNGHIITALSYILFSITLGLAAVFTGLALSRFVA